MKPIIAAIVLGFAVVIYKKMFLGTLERVLRVVITYSSYKKILVVLKKFENIAFYHLVSYILKYFATSLRMSFRILSAPS